MTFLPSCLNQLQRDRSVPIVSIITTYHHVLQNIGVHYNYDVNGYVFYILLLSLICFIKYYFNHKDNG